MLRDAFGRRVDYLRLSITDRCNLRCIYCMPPEGVPLKPRSEILTYDELLRTVRLAACLGVRKVRITGGEPLVRGGVVDFVARVARIGGIRDLAMTTNGLGLDDLARPLKAAGLHRVNVSLDTIRPDRYAEITRRDLLRKALAGIDAALSAGLSPVKINVVLLHGLLRGEIEDFLEMARESPVQVRFIERMPLGGCLASEGYVSADGVRDRLLALPGARERIGSGADAAAVFEIPGFAGTLGVITPVSRRFCSSCNRLRVTADGSLRNCLFTRETLDLKRILRGGGSDDDVVRLLRQAVAAKPESHDLCGGGGQPCAEPMSRVGG